MMMAHLFDSLMKAMLMLIDGVLENREQYAIDLSKRNMRRIVELEETIAKSKENFETQWNH